MKKKITAIALLAAMLCGLTACGGSSASTTAATAATEAPTAANDGAQPAAGFSADDVTAAVLAEIPINSDFEKKKESIPDYFDGLDESTVTDFSYHICASGAYPDEIAVFRFGSADEAAAAVPAVKDRLDYQSSTYKDYTPDEYYKLENAVVEQSGEWVYYIVTSDNDKARSIVKGFIG